MGWDEFDTQQHPEPQGDCFEFALALDPTQRHPGDATLTLTGPDGEKETIALADGVEEGGFVSCRFSTPTPGAEYSLTYAAGGKSTVFFDGAELYGFVEDATGLTETVITTRVVDTRGKTLPIDAAYLEAAGQTRPLAEATSQGDWWRDISSLDDGDLVLAVESDGETRIALTLSDNGALGAPTLAFKGTRPNGVSLIRVRGGQPGDWSAIYFLVTVIVPARYALFIPCSYDFKAGDGSYFLTVAKKLKKTYTKQGYAGCTICATNDWEEVITVLEKAAKDGKPFSRFITIGHGGWDGPILDHQWSRFEVPNRFQALLAAAKKALTRDAKAFFSNCHSGGSNKYEWAGDLKQRRADKTELRKLKLALAKAKAALRAASGESQATRDSLGRTVADAELEVEYAEDALKWYDVAFSRWVEDFAKGAECYAAGPMGGTSTTYTEQHVKAVLEEDGKVKQEVYVADPFAQQIHVIPASGKLSDASMSPMDNPPSVASALQRAAASAIETGGRRPGDLPSHVLLPSELGL